MDFPQTIVASACVAIPTAILTAYMGRVNERVKSRRDRLADCYAEILIEVELKIQAIRDYLEDGGGEFGNTIPHVEMRSIINPSQRLKELASITELLEDDITFHFIITSILRRIYKIKYSVSSYYDKERGGDFSVGQISDFSRVLMDTNTDAYSLKILFLKKYYPPPHPALRLAGRALRGLDGAVRQVCQSTEETLDQMKEL